MERAQIWSCVDLSSNLALLHHGKLFTFSESQFYYLECGNGRLWLLNTEHVCARYRIDA